MARTVDPKRHAARRQHILDCAAGLFAKHGYERTTTAQLCRSAAISPGNLYHYFSGKKQIFIAVLTQDEQDTTNLLNRLMQNAQPLEALLEYVDHLATPAAAHSLVPKLVLEAILQAHRDPEIKNVLERADGDERAGISALLQRAVAAGETDPTLNPQEAAEWISAMISGVYLEAALHEGFDVTRHLGNLHRTVHTYLSRGIVGRSASGPLS